MVRDAAVCLRSQRDRVQSIVEIPPELARRHHGVEILGDAFVSVQNQYAPDFRSSEPELELCTELGLAFLPWSPLGGAGAASRSAGNGFSEVAAEHGVSPQQVALAWMLAKSPAVIPIPGSSRPETITDSAAAAELELTADQLVRLR